MTRKRVALLAVGAVGAVALISAVVVAYLSGREQQATFAKIREWGGWVETTERVVDKSGGTAPLLRIHLAGSAVSDADLEYLKGLKCDSRLDLSRTRITDDGLALLEKMAFPPSSSSTDKRPRPEDLPPGGRWRRVHGMPARLKGLSLAYTRVTDRGLELFSRGANWRIDSLDLSNTKVTDASLAYLAGLHLRTLILQGTDITDSGLKHLRDGDVEPSVLDLSDTAITDEGIKRLFIAIAGVPDHLQGPWIHVLKLNGTKVTGAALRDLKSAPSTSMLNELEIARTAITDSDLEWLKGFRNLAVIDLRGTKVTAEKVSDLRIALPGVSVKR